jgi:hypothetical protein
MSTYAKTLEKAAKWASLEFDRLITVESLRTRTKALSHSHPRFFAMAYMRAMGRYSLPQIAIALHLKDHTTVLHGLRRAHGYDGKAQKNRNMPEPLWKEEQFKNMVRQDWPELFDLDDDWTFKSGDGWGHVA